MVVFVRVGGRSRWLSRVGHLTGWKGKQKTRRGVVPAFSPQPIFLRYSTCAYAVAQNKDFLVIRTHKSSHSSAISRIELVLYL